MKAFEKRLQALNREMLIHACIGHPIAATLSLFGFRGAAEWVHYRSLPFRARKKLDRQGVKVTFDHSPELFWADVFFNPLATVARAYGRYWLSNRIFFSGPWQACLRHDSCNMTPDESRWAQEQYEKITGKSMYETLGDNARPGLALEKMGMPVWSGQARGKDEPPPMLTKPPKKAKARLTPLFERLMKAKFTRMGLRRIGELLDIQLSRDTDPMAIKAAIGGLDQERLDTVTRMIEEAES